MVRWTLRKEKRNFISWLRREIELERICCGLGWLRIEIEMCVKSILGTCKQYFENNECRKWESEEDRIQRISKEEVRAAVKRMKTERQLVQMTYLWEVQYVYV